MKVSGTAVLHAPVERVWEALNDPAVLVRTIPGCEQLEEVGPDRYRMTITAGVASIKGTYVGDVALTEQHQPASFVLKASGSGAPGTVSADVTVDLSAGDDGTTRLSYDADAVVAGPVGGVGQRVLSGVAKKTAGEFFRAVDDVLMGKAPAAAPTAEESGAGGAVPSAVSAAAAAPGGAVFRAPAGRGSGGSGGGSGDLLRGAVLGAAIALVGAAVGGLLARRRT
jgi:carbon monoxide dehydrogenase subunit G